MKKDSKTECLVSIREASSLIFDELRNRIPRSTIQTWLQHAVFIPYQPVAPRDPQGCRLSISDLVLLSLLRAIFAVGVRLTTSLRTGDAHWYNESIEFWWATRFQDLNQRLRRDPNREVQTFLELCDYNVLIQIEPVTGRGKRKHAILIIDAADPEFEKLAKDKINVLAPETNVWVRPHYEFVVAKLRKHGLLKP